MRLLSLTFLAALAGCSPSAEPSAAVPVSRPKVVLLMRHAEKPADDADPNLNAAGKKRAEALPGLFGTRPELPTPDFLFAAKASKKSNRSVETATPLAAALKLDLNTAYANEDYPKLAAELLSNPVYAGKTVLVVWHHGNLPPLAAALGVKGVPAKWDDNYFDRVWAVTFDAEGKAQPLGKLCQSLMPGDAKE